MMLETIWPEVICGGVEGGKALYVFKLLEAEMPGEGILNLLLYQKYLQ